MPLCGARALHVEISDEVGLGHRGVALVVNVGASGGQGGGRAGSLDALGHFLKPHGVLRVGRGHGGGLGRAGGGLTTAHQVIRLGGREGLAVVVSDARGMVGVSTWSLVGGEDFVWVWCS